jgi:hypothetical protein
MWRTTYHWKWHDEDYPSMRVLHAFMIVLHTLFLQSTSGFMTSPLGITNHILQGLPVDFFKASSHEVHAYSYTIIGPLWILLQIQPSLLKAYGLLLGLTSMKTNFPTISPFGIDGKNHTPPVIISPPIFMLSPLIFMILFFLSPFDINGKG